jgi:hypothetical protein
MNCPAPFSLQPSPLVRGAGVLAALLASFGAVGTIDAMALHYSRQPQASTLVRANHAFRCGVPRATPAAPTAS